MTDQSKNESTEIQKDLQKDNDINESQPEKEGGNREDLLTAGNQTPEIATNDGSVIETLDTALHGSPGWSEGENPSGSDRAGYYEARSYGKSDAEEELDDLRERNKTKSGKNTGSQP